MCVCVVIPFILDIRFVDVPAGVAQKKYLIYAVLALIFIAIRIQPSLSLVEREVVSVYPRISRSPLPILSTCPLHTNSGCGNRGAHINWSMMTSKTAAPVTETTLRTTGPVPADSRH